MENYYEILNCENFSPVEEVKKKFADLALRFHPDKNSDDDFDVSIFQNINRAWNVLKDPESKRDYDSLLKIHFERNRPPVLAYLTIKELNKMDGDDYYSYPCRCGAFYQIYEEDCDEPETYYECEECSFNILIRNGNT